MKLADGLWVDEIRGRCHARKMKRTILLGVFAGVALVACATAQERGYWRAASNTARSITGDVSLSDEKLVLNFSGYTIAKIRALQPAELGAAFDADSNAGGSGNLYRLDVPATKRLVHKNTLCGTEDTKWMATYVAGRTLQLAFFSGQTVPVFKLEALSNSSDLCGTFSYVR
jgi:hypothetical protein